jgi:hypothetical protein
MRPFPWKGELTKALREAASSGDKKWKQTRRPDDCRQRGKLTKSDSLSRGADHSCRSSAIKKDNPGMGDRGLSFHCVFVPRSRTGGDDWFTTG